MNKKGDMDDINWFAVFGGLIGGFISLIVGKSMGGGFFIRILGFIITGVICYFLCDRLLDD